MIADQFTKRREIDPPFFCQPLERHTVRVYFPTQNFPETTSAVCRLIGVLFFNKPTKPSQIRLFPKLSVNPGHFQTETLPKIDMGL
jgi:hypothetical protein